MLWAFSNSSGAPLPNGVIEQKTTEGCVSDQPEARSSMTASAVAISLCRRSTSAADVTSRTADRLFVLRYANSALPSRPSARTGAIARVALPRSGVSTLITSAPKSANSFPQYSPATDSANSTTLMPVSADMRALSKRSGLLASRAAQAPLRREVQVVVLHHIVEALAEGPLGEVDLVLPVVGDQRQHALDHAGQQAPEVFPLVLLVQLQEGLLHRDGVGGTRAGTRHRVLQRLLFQLLAGHHAIDKAAFVHLLRAERPSGEQHFGEFPQPHRLAPPPQARSPAHIAEGRVTEKGVVRGDHQIGVAGLIEVPPVAVALGLDDADLAKLLQRPISRTCFRVEVRDGGQVAVRPARRVLDVVVVDRQLVQQRQAGVLQHRALLGQVPATAEILALTTDHHDFHVVIHVALVDQIGVVLPHPQGGCVLRVGTIERDVGDSVLLVLLELDVLLGFLLQLFVVVLRHVISPTSFLIELVPT